MQFCVLIKLSLILAVVTLLVTKCFADTQPVSGRSIRFPGQLTSWGQNIWSTRHQNPQEQQTQQQTRETRSGSFNFFNNLNLNRFSSRTGKVDTVSAIEKPAMAPPKWKSFGGNNLKKIDKIVQSSSSSAAAAAAANSGLDPALANQIQSFAQETKTMMARMDEQVPRDILNPFKYFVAAGNRLVRMWDETKRKNARDDSVRMPGTFDLLSFAVEQMKKLSDGQSFRTTDGVNESTPPSEALVQGLFMVKELTRRALRCDDTDYYDDDDVEEEETMSANEVRRRSLGQKRSASSGGDKTTTDGVQNGQKKRKQSQACKLLSARFHHIKSSLAES